VGFAPLNPPYAFLNVSAALLVLGAVLAAFQGKLKQSQKS